MAYIRKLPSGNFNAVVRLPNGKRKSITDPLKRVVQQKAGELEAAMRRGETVHLRDRRIMVAAWHAKWLKTRMVEASTARKNESSWRNHIEPRWGGWPLDSVIRRDVQEWVKDLTDAGVGPHAIGDAYQLFATMMGEAADGGLIPASPCRKITLPRRGKPEPRWFSRDEYDRLQLTLGSATTTLGGRTKVPDPHAPVWQALVGLGCFSGLRPGELAGLDISAIDFERRLVRVTQVLARLPDGKKPDGRAKYRWAIRRYPKSDRSIRSVPFPEEVGELLWRIVADRGSGPVFTAHRGGRINYEGNFRNRVWLPALAPAGIEPVRPYVMRHTFASWMVQGGVSDRRIMQYLGHADAHLIEVYAHLDPHEHDEIRAVWGEVSPSSRRTDDPRAPHDGEAQEQKTRSGGRSASSNGL
jgi:integrase